MKLKSTTYFDLLWEMVIKEIRVKYYHAVLGVFWMGLIPLLQGGVIWVISTIFIKIPDYFLFLLVGLTLWHYYSSSVAMAASSFVNERQLVHKAGFPKELIPISVIISNTANLAVPLATIIVYFMVFRMMSLIDLFLILIGVAWIVLLVIGLSLLAATLNVRFRDINHAIQPTLNLWFYATPVLYSLSSVPTEMFPYFYFNPLSSVLEIFHLAFFGQGMINKYLLLGNISVSCLIIVSGITMFRKYRTNLADWL